MHAAVCACMHLRERPTVYVLLGSVLTGRGLETWHGSLELEDHLPFVSVLICYVARLGLVLFWLDCYIYELSWIPVTWSFLEILVAAEKQVKIAWPVVWSLRSGLMLQRLHLCCIQKGDCRTGKHQSWRLVAPIFTQVGCQHQHSWHCIKMDTGAGLVLTWIFLCESPDAGWRGPLSKQPCWVLPQKEFVPWLDIFCWKYLP